ncbi:16094_t:CDS:2 [Entrophospora sp. SA101]|nr:16094_t:CDS:2 [Entrophospora sp. SA101]
MEVTLQFNALKSELQNIAQKLGELESESEEHKAVIDTLAPLSGDRKCFRLVGGVLAERTVKDVLPALQTNYDMIQGVIDQLVKNYKKKEEEFIAFQKDNNIPQPNTSLPDPTVARICLAKPLLLVKLLKVLKIVLLHRMKIAVGSATAIESRN